MSTKDASQKCACILAQALTATAEYDRFFCCKDKRRRYVSTAGAVCERDIAALVRRNVDLVRWP